MRRMTSCAWMAVGAGLMILAGCGGGGAMAGQDVKKQAAEYRGDLKMMAEDPGAWVVQNGRTSPEFRVTVVNAGRKDVGHLKVVGTLRGGDEYQDVQVVVPVLANGKTAVLDKDGGRTTFTVKFADKAVNAEALLRTKVSYQFEVTEVGFAE